ncbi:hypothetical protein GCM10010358_52990 [Streptomyces minutiscleroticus]|uniref:Uncharacterized protein n=1 Tax=Streptomyces minutiscleroticus TaxID=68238 RepID=A0A918U4U2_9ACTN|nr:hypothetical protein GCM10010358_52990 [Streptomyces minutiscleroticus]
MLRKRTATALCRRRRNVDIAMVPTPPRRRDVRSGRPSAPRHAGFARKRATASLFAHRTEQYARRPAREVST